MERMLELCDIALMPTAMIINKVDGIDFGVTDPLDGSSSLPIFTSPVDSIINTTNWKTWEKAGIKPILPRTIPISPRLDGCQYMFAAFSLKEVIENFISQGKRQSQFQFHICIDAGNGHDVEILQTATKLRQIYNNQVNIMAGNIGNAKIYPDYCRAEINYVRVGMTGGSLCTTPDKYGFQTPLVSLLLDITGLRNTACIGLKQTKVIADGGIYTPAEILKALAVGADYVMCGRVFVKLLEAAGTIYRKVKTPDGGEVLEAVSPDIINTGTFKELKLKRYYMGNTTKEAVDKRGGNISRFTDAKSEWVEINNTLNKWIEELYNVFTYGFMMSGSKNWTEFKNNIRYGRIE